MKGAVQKVVGEFFGRLIQLGYADGDKAEVIEGLLLRIIRNHIDNKQRLLEADMAYEKGDLSHDEAVDLRRRLGCYELTVKPKAPKRTINELLGTGLLEERRDGVCLGEPAKQTPFNVVSYQSPAADFGRLGPVIVKTFNAIADFFGFLTLLRDRRELANAIADRILVEPAILLSRSPAIFNPLEFEDALKNHTRYLAGRIKNSQQPVVYVWDMASVLNQVRAHAQQLRKTESELLAWYIDHFAPYAQNENLTVVCGDNAAISPDWLRIPFLSPTHKARGERVAGKFERGALLDGQAWGRCGPIVPSAGQALGAVMGQRYKKRFMDLRRAALSEPSSVVLDKHDGESIRAFVGQLFHRAFTQTDD